MKPDILIDFGESICSKRPFRRCSTGQGPGAALLPALPVVREGAVPLVLVAPRVAEGHHAVGLAVRLHLERR